MERIEVHPDEPRRVTVGPDRRAAGLVAGILCGYAALLLSIHAAGHLTLGLKGYIVLGASLIAPLLMLAQAARRTFRVRGDTLSISGPFGLGDTCFELSTVQASLTEVEVLMQPSYRLSLSLPDERTRVVCTWVADRYPLVEALRDVMAPDVTAAVLKHAATLADRERQAQRGELLRFVAVACVSLVGGAILLVWGAALFG